MTNTINEQVLHINSFLWGYFENIDNKKLKKMCEDNYNNRLSNNKDSGINEDIVIKKTKEIKLLIKNFKKIIKTKFNKDVELIGFWSQVHQHNESCGLHSHIDPDDLKNSSDLAAVYYVNIPKESGKLVLNYYINKFKFLEWFFPPEDNKYIIFPASWDHRVSKNLSKNNRVSIAFNFKFLK